MADTSPKRTKTGRTGGHGPVALPEITTSISMQHKKPAQSSGTTPDQELARTQKSTTSQSTKHKAAPVAQSQEQQGKIKVRLVGPGHDPSKNKAWMGNEVPVLGLGMVPALSLREAGIVPWVVKQGAAKEAGKAKLVKGGTSAKK
jgi:hypothetical protein